MNTPIFLTFDDGPYAMTNTVLHILRTKGLKATFFLNLKHNAKDPAMQRETILQIMKDGHALGSHGYDHNPEKREEYARSTPEAVKEDYVKNEIEIKKLLGTNSPRFSCARLPGNGSFRPNFVSMIVREFKIPHVGWKMEFSFNGKFNHLPAQDWQGIKGVAGEFSRLPRANEILLLHERHWAGKLASLEELLDKLKTKFRSLPLSKDNIPRGNSAVTFPQ